MCKMFVVWIMLDSLDLNSWFNLQISIIFFTLGHAITCLAELHTFLKYWTWIVATRAGGSHVGELKSLDTALSTAEHHLRVIKAFMKREAESLAKVQVPSLSQKLGVETFVSKNYFKHQKIFRGFVYAFPSFKIWSNQDSSVTRTKYYTFYRLDSGTWILMTGVSWTFFATNSKIATDLFQFTSPLAWKRDACGASCR